MTINKLHVHKILITGLVFCGLSVCIAVRLVYLQVLQRQRLTVQSINNCTRRRSIQLPRGNIVDCHGKLIATNRPVINLYWRGTGNRQFTAAQEELLHQLEQLTGKNFAALRPSLQRAERLAGHIYVAQDIPFSVLTKVIELTGNHPNILIKSHFERFYPYGHLASHVIGYLGKCDLDLIGKMGVEKLSHQELKGIEGVQQALINAVGKELAASIIQKGETGKTIQTTLDLDLQQLAEANFNAEFSGTLVIMDPTNGAIRAMLSRPSFDPTMFLNPIDQTEWASLQQGRPFVNRAVTACYPPASLFKIVTLSAGLELGIINENTTTFCPGHVVFAQRRYHCSKQQGHGTLTLKEALAHSCNIIFFEIAKRISIDTLADYAGRYGLGKPSGIALEEKTGLVPSSAWKLRVKGERWWPGETLSAVIGQSYTLATPMQLLRMYCGLYTGFLPKPRLLEQEEIVREPVNVQESVRHFLLKGMKAAIEYGTGVRIRQVKDITVYAKTGTAQTSDLAKRELGKQFVEHAWLVALFQYREEQPLAMIILMEHAGKSSYASQVAKQFLIAYKKLVNQQYELRSSE